MLVSESVSHIGILLKGSMVRTDYLDITITGVLENLPGINSPAVLQFQPAIETHWPDGKPAKCECWGMNKTNLMILAELSGLDDTAHWRGLKVRLKKVMQNNPQNGQQVPSFMVDSVFRVPVAASEPAVPTAPKGRKQR